MARPTKETLEDIDKFNRALDSTENLFKNGEIKLNKDGTFEDKDVQFMLTMAIDYGWKSMSQNKWDKMDDKSRIDFIRDLHENPNGLKASMNGRWELSGKIADLFEGNKEKMTKAIEDIMNNKDLNDEDKKRALENVLKDCKKEVLNKITELSGDNKILESTSSNLHNLKKEESIGNHAQLTNVLNF